MRMYLTCNGKVINVKTFEIISDMRTEHTYQRSECSHITTNCCGEKVVAVVVIQALSDGERDQRLNINYPA